MSKARTLSNFISSGSLLADGAISVSEVSGAAPSDSPSFTGNITVSGTVDGRDIAADGTKLDSIEAGATADQTAAEIKTAYESNANTNAFTDAEQSKLAGIEAGATADQTASEILTSIKTVDGSASGLDADLLDGQQGSYYYSPANPPPLPLTEQPVLSKTGGDATMFNHQNCTITITNYANYSGASFTYILKNSDGQSVASGSFSTSSITFNYTDNHIGLLTVDVSAQETGFLASPASSIAFTMITHRAYKYYRISNVIGANGNTSGGIAEWRVFSGVNQTGTDLEPVLITSSYYYSGTYSDQKVRDGNVSTMWWTLGNANPQWIKFFMGNTPPTVVSMRLNTYNNSNYGFENGVLEGSDQDLFAGEQEILVADLDLLTFLTLG